MYLNKFYIFTRLCILFLCFSCIAVKTGIASSLTQPEIYTVELSENNSPKVSGSPLTLSLPSLESPTEKNRLNSLKMSWDEYYGSLLSGDFKSASKFSLNGEINPSLRISTGMGGKIAVLLSVYKNDTIRAILSFTVRQKNNSEFKIYNCDVWNWTEASGWKVSSAMYD